VVGALLATRIAFSLVQISRPGLQYDETMFVNAATLRIPGMYIAHSLGGIPLMVFPYTGALKSWLYDPLFAVFGTSPATIRVPVVLLASAGLALAYLAIRDLVNPLVALLALAALCFDGSLFWLTRDDVGPSAIELFLKCAALWCAGRLFVTRSTRWVWLLLGVLVLGLFNKLNFIWVVNAVAAASVFVLARYRRALRTHRRAVALWLAGLAVIYAGFGAYYFGDHIASFGAGPGSSSSLGQPWSAFALGMRLVLSGTWFYDYALGPAGPRDGVALLFIILFAIGALSSLLPGRGRNFAVAMLALVTLAIGVQTLATSQATAGWHYIAIYPFVTVVAAYGAYRLAKLIARRRVLAGAALLCVGAATLTYDGLLLNKYLADLAAREPANPGWTPAVYRLSSELQSTRTTVFTADWGISNPLFALHPSHRYVELAFELQAGTSGQVRRVRKSLAAWPGAKLVVTHAHDRLFFAGANQHLFAALGRHLRLVRSVDGRDGRPVYLIYAYR
jgi:hypothetical protein